MIKVFSWNCRGASHANFFTAFKSYLSDFCPNVVILVEPRISGITAAGVCDKLGFDGCFREEAVGFAGGIWVLWHKTEISLRILESSRQFVSMLGSSNGMGDFHLTAVYGSPSSVERVNLWSDLCRLSSQITIPWLVMGDFNAMVSSSDKRGGARFSISHSQPFIDCCDICGLIDPGVIGPRFTWYRNSTSERLDRGLINSEWILKFPYTIIRHLRRQYSDHRPILLLLDQSTSVKLPKPFKFLAPWLGHEGFQDILKGAWVGDGDLPIKLQNLTPRLRRWNKTTFGNVFQRKRDLLHKLEEISGKIDRKIRNFIWGSSNGDRKIHLLNWKKICSPKSKGGLGIRSAKELNFAFLMKLCWGMMKKPTELWVQLLMSKYLKHTPTGLVPRNTKRLSACWRGMQEVWPIFAGGLAWGVRDGRTVNFWRERWIDNGIILGDLVSPTPGSENMVVADLCSPSGDWDIATLKRMLPQDALEAVIGMTPPCSDAGADLPIWGLEANGQYSVSSGYTVACEIDDDSDNRWAEIWRWEGPQRVRHFLWLAAHNKLLTNAERHRRHLTTSDECGGCNSASESVIHIARDCLVAREVWYEMLGVNSAHEFFQIDESDWWKKYVSDKRWASIFGITTWTLWKVRNDRIFEGKAQTKDSILARCRFWLRLTATSYEEARNLKQSTITQRRLSNVGWRAAGHQFTTLNTDGSVRGRRGRAAAGGCIRDEAGRLLDAFACNLGRCSVTRAELTGAVVGLQRAWELGVRKVEVQMDSSCSINMLEGKSNLEHQHAGLVLRFKQLAERSWTIRLTHIYREGNHLADHLANKGHDLDYGTHTIRRDDDSVLYWARYDAMGCEEQRLICAL
ncbi:Putative ribonuclease H protein At1g65750 [Linum perenne]